MVFFFALLICHQEQSVYFKSVESIAVLMILKLMASDHNSEQELFQRTHPVHYLDSKAQGVGVDLSIPSLRTPSMTR